MREWNQSRATSRVMAAKLQKSGVVEMDEVDEPVPEDAEDQDLLEKYQEMAYVRLHLRCFSLFIIALHAEPSA